MGQKKLKLFRLPPLLLILCVVLALSTSSFATERSGRVTYLDEESDWFVQFGGNVGFNPDYESGIMMVFKAIKSEFEDIFGKETVNARRTLSILHDAENVPITYRMSDNPELTLNVIFLSSDGGYYQKHTYQLSHELCHFMIPSGVCGSYRWFEETLGELMSWTILHRIHTHEAHSRVWEILYPNIDVHESFQSYIAESMQERTDLAESSVASFIKENEAHLFSEPYDRDANSAIAYAIYPLFQEHPELWRIVPVLNCMDEAKSLRENLIALGSLAKIPDKTMSLLIRILCGSTFGDVSPSAYYLEAVNWAVDKGITKGTSADTFAPIATCTRGQVATFLWRAKGCPEPATTVNPFTDVDPSSAFYKAILWAAENGVTAGTSDTTFSPGNPCTRAHVVTFLWRAQGKPEATGAAPLADSFPQGYYTDAVRWADAAGLLDGTGEAFAPSALCPRADIVTYLYRNLA